MGPLREDSQRGDSESNKQNPVFQAFFGQERAVPRAEELHIAGVGTVQIPGRLGSARRPARDAIRTRGIMRLRATGPMRSTSSCGSARQKKQEKELDRPPLRAYIWDCLNDASSLTT